MVSSQAHMILARCGSTGLYVLAVSALVLLIRPAASGQAQRMTLTIVAEGTSSVVTDAQIMVDIGSAGYWLGAPPPNWVVQAGISVTDPVVPPHGFKLQATSLNWTAIRQIEFSACRPYQ